MHTKSTTPTTDTASDAYGLYAAERIRFHLHTAVKGHPVYVLIDSLDQWVASIPSTSGRRESYITNQRHCDCPGYSFSGHCKHIAISVQAYLQLSPIVNEIRRKTQSGASTDEYGAGMRLLARYSVQAHTQKEAA